MYTHRTLLATVVAIVAICIVSLIPPADAADTFAQNSGTKRIISVQEENAEDLLAIEGVVGTAAGDGHVLVLAADEQTAERVPAEVGGIPTKVSVTGEIRALGLDPKARLERPVPTGVSTGNERGYSAGTIACMVTDGKHTYALSTNHVYALGNKAPVGSKILQPGLVDTDGEFYEENVIAELYDYSLIVFSDSPDTQNQIDAAIARCAEGSDCLGVTPPKEGYGAPSRETVEGELGMAVQKYGRSTRLTRGEIVGVNGIINVQYQSGVARFVDQIMVKPSGEEKQFVARGDSGALLVTQGEEANPVGLLFAGNAEGSIAFANPIDEVLERFKVEIGNTPPGALADLAVTEVDVPMSVIKGEAVDVQITVVNQGTQDLRDAVTVRLTDESGGMQIGEQTLADGVVAGGKKVLTFTWETSGIAAGNHMINATHDHTDQTPDNDARSVPVTVTEGG